jgi:hypothetical protein
MRGQATTVDTAVVGRIVHRVAIELTRLARDWQGTSSAGLEPDDFAGLV